jgi:hypothetical protein
MPGMWHVRRNLRSFAVLRRHSTLCEGWSIARGSGSLRMTRSSIGRSLRMTLNPNPGRAIHGARPSLVYWGPIKTEGLANANRERITRSERLPAVASTADRDTPHASG